MSPTKSADLCNMPLQCYLRLFSPVQQSKRNKKDKWNWVEKQVACETQAEFT